MFYIRRYRPKTPKGTMNKTELEYSQHLQKLKLAGEIEDWAFEPETLKIGGDCRYTPDFRVIKQELHKQGMEDGSDWHQFGGIVEFHEVKGTIRKKDSDTTKPYIEDDALVKIKAAAELHPFKFIIIWKGRDGNWQHREIN
jgi:hypothetical protein